MQKKMKCKKILMALVASVMLPEAFGQEIVSPDMTPVYYADEAEVIAAHSVVPEVIDIRTGEMVREVTNYYKGKIVRSQREELSDTIRAWMRKEVTGCFLVSYHPEYHLDTIYSRYKRHCLDVMLRKMNPEWGLTALAIALSVTIGLDSTQLQELRDAMYRMSEELRQLPDEVLSDTQAADAPRWLRFPDKQIREALQANDSILYQHFVDVDHETALNVLSKKQFRRVACFAHPEIKDETFAIWNKLDSANMVYDLKESTARYHIQEYLTDIKVAEETYWNDTKRRGEARHRIKVYAPYVIKRYFSLRPKKRNPQKQSEKSNNVNYLW